MSTFIRQFTLGERWLKDFTNGVNTCQKRMENDTDGVGFLRLLAVRKRVEVEVKGRTYSVQWRE